MLEDKLKRRNEVRARVEALKLAFREQAQTLRKAYVILDCCDPEESRPLNLPHPEDMGERLQEFRELSKELEELEKIFE
jgi:hypothetical protein